MAMATPSTVTRLPPEACELLDVPSSPPPSPAAMDISDAPATASPPPTFSSLVLNLINPDGSIGSPFNANARQGVPLSTDVFEGHALILLRPKRPSDDEHYSSTIFGPKTKKTIELQVQGRFKKLPTGTIFLGSELSSVPKLSMITRGVLKVILGFTRRQEPNLHYSLGDAARTQLPHGVMPLHTSADYLQLTPPGQTPPALGSPLEETAAETAARRSSPAKWDTESTLTFSFHSQFLDLANWKACGFPMVGPQDLHGYIQNAALRFVVYEAPIGAKEHLQSAIKYVVGAQVRNVDGPAVPAPSAPMKSTSKQAVESNVPRVIVTVGGGREFEL